MEEAADTVGTAAAVNLLEAEDMEATAAMAETELAAAEVTVAPAETESTTMAPAVAEVTVAPVAMGTVAPVRVAAEAAGAMKLKRPVPAVPALLQFGSIQRRLTEYGKI